MKTNEFIRKLRIERGWSQQELSDYMGAGRTSISMYEKGTREISIQTLERLGELFHVSPYQLLLPPCDSQMAERIKYLSEYLKIPVEDIYKHTRISAQKLLLFLDGQENLSQKEIEKIAETFKVPVGLLVDGFATDCDGNLYTMENFDNLSHMIQPTIWDMLSTDELERIQKAMKLSEIETEQSTIPKHTLLRVKAELSEHEIKVLEKALSSMKNREILVSVAEGLLK